MPRRVLRGAILGVALAVVAAAAAPQARAQDVGEVLRPGEYVMPANSTISDALQRAGGLTSGAFVFGTEFSRESVREVQQQNYERALRDLETSMARAATSGRVHPWCR